VGKPYQWLDFKLGSKNLIVTSPTLHLVLPCALALPPQMISMFSRIQPPLAGFWFLLPGQDMGAEVMVRLRAHGCTQVRDSPALAPQGHRLHTGSAGSQQPPQQHADMACVDSQQLKAGAGVSDAVTAGQAVSSSARRLQRSTSSEPGRPELNDEDLFQAKRAGYWPSQLYNSSDDEAISKDADDARLMTAVATKLQQLADAQYQARQQELQSLHGIEGPDDDLQLQQHHPALVPVLRSLATARSVAVRARERLQSEQERCQQQLQRTPAGLSWDQSCHESLHRAPHPPHSASSGSAASSSSVSDALVMRAASLAAAALLLALAARTHLTMHQLTPE